MKSKEEEGCTKRCQQRFKVALNAFVYVNPMLITCLLLKFVEMLVKIGPSQHPLLFKLILLNCIVCCQLNVQQKGHISIKENPFDKTFIKAFLTLSIHHVYLAHKPFVVVVRVQTEKLRDRIERKRM